MKELYNVTIYYKFLWFLKKKVIKNVKNHYFPQDFHGFVLNLILKDETNVFINLNNLIHWNIPREGFLKILEDIKEETNGQVTEKDINYDKN